MTSVTPLFFSSLRDIKGIKTNSEIAHEKIYMYIYSNFGYMARVASKFISLLFVFIYVPLYLTLQQKIKTCHAGVYIYIVNFTSPLILILSDCKALFNTAYVYSALLLRAAVIECTSEFKQHTEFKL